jgi:L-threonylcarbamoyladenylate synthase
MTEFNEDLLRCLDILYEGGLILYPTDTIWGIGCDATNEEALQKIITLKKRDAAKSLIVLLASERDVLKYTTQADLRVFDLLRSAQKPTTVIYEGAIGLAPQAIHADGTVAIRVVNELFCKHLIKRFRKPVISTSANISGEDAPSSYRAVHTDIRNGVDYIVKYRQDDESIRQPSSIVRWNRDATVTIIRP